MALPFVISTIPISTISVSPSILPYPPESSPSLSPDITPLFPHPSSGPSPSSEPDIPTIPSSPSPPNPDQMFGPGPSADLSPSEAIPLPTSTGVDLFGRIGTSWLIVFFGLEYVFVYGVFLR